MKKHLMRFLILSALVVPLIALGQTTDIAALIQQLQQQVAALRQQIIALQNATQRTTTTTTTTVPGAFQIGSKVITNRLLYTRTDPSLTAATPILIPQGSTGTIMDGPVSAGGYEWYLVNYDIDIGIVGWSAKIGLNPLSTTATSDTTTSFAATGTGTVTITSVEPASISLGDVSYVLKLTGTGFKSANIIRIDDGYMRQPVPSADNRKVLECLATEQSACKAESRQRCEEARVRYQEKNGTLPPADSAFYDCNATHWRIAPHGAGAPHDSCWYLGKSCSSYAPETTILISMRGPQWAAFGGAICSELKANPLIGGRPTMPSGHVIVLDAGPHTIRVENENGISNAMTFTLTGPTAVDLAINAREKTIFNQEYVILASKAVLRNAKIAGNPESIARAEQRLKQQEEFLAKFHNMPPVTKASMEAQVCK